MDSRLCAEEAQVFLFSYESLLGDEILLVRKSSVLYTNSYQEFRSQADCINGLLNWPEVGIHSI